MKLWPTNRRRDNSGHVTRSDVVTAYKTILGRPPESEAAINSHLAHRDVWSLISVIMDSAEFKRRRNEQSSDYYNQAWRRLAAPLAIDCNIKDDETYARLENRVRQIWNRLGKEEPYFSVITDQRFLIEGLAPNRQDFYALGKADAELVRSTLARTQVGPGTLQTCVEYGCGVGRATWQLAALFDKIIAIDVSTSHIDVARQWISDLGIKNVEWRKIDGLTDIYDKDYDFWFSRIVLQHNPPPMIVRILTEALTHLRLGGFALFQVPTYIKDYKFDLEDYLGAFGEVGQMEMHCVPQQILINTIIATGCELVEIIEDQDVGSPDGMISNTILVKKVRHAAQTNDRHVPGGP